MTTSLDAGAVLRALGHATADQVLVVTAAGEVLWCSDTVTDARLPVLWRPDGRDLADHELPHVRAARGERVCAERLVTPGPAAGEPRAVSVTAEALPEEQPDGPRVLLVLRDAAEARDRLRDLVDFAGVVAHDLGSPANLVASFAEMAVGELARLEQDGVDVGLTGELVRRSGRQAGRMSRMVQDLVDLSASDRHDLVVEPVELAVLVSDVAADLQVRYPDAEFVMPGDLGTVHGDRTLLRQVVVNLLRNAVKYTPPDRDAVVSVSSARAGDRLVVTVSDEGSGVPDAEREAVFEPFRRGSNRGEAKGTGLGLTLCRRAVARHGGSIALADNPVGVGTSVVLDLPAGG